MKLPFALSTHSGLRMVLPALLLLATAVVTSGCDLRSKLQAAGERESQAAEEPAEGQQGDTEQSELDPACEGVATDTFELVDKPGDGLRDGDVARVGHIVDGDTLDVIVGGEKFKVRLQGMNTPECDKEQDDRTHRYACVSDDEGYGMASYEAAVDVLEGAHVKVSCDDVEEGERCETDPYDRYLVYLEIPCFGDLGEHLVERGLAQTFTRYDSSKRAQYCRAEYAAREARRGMWRGGSISSMLEEMSQSTRSWYRTHDARCDAAIEELSNSSP